MQKKQHLKYGYLIILVSVFLFSCKSHKQEMDIHYFSLNDYDTNYVFDIENNVAALKKMHQYVLKEISDQKHAVDSLLKSDYMNTIPKTYNDHLNNTSLSLTATDVYLYTPPSELSFDRVRDKDLVMLYELDENTFAIKNISVGNRYKTASYAIEETKNINQCTLKVDTEKFTLETLSQVFKKIKELKYQLKHDTFIYHITDIQDKHILDIKYEDKGTSLLLDYK